MKIFYFNALLIILFGAFLAFFSALVVFRLKLGNPKANRLFSLLLFSAMVFLVRGFFLLSDLYTSFPLAVEIIDNFRYFICPALYYYVKVIADPAFRFRNLDTVQLLPLLFNLLVRSKFYFSAGDDQVRFVSQWLDGSILQPGYYWDSASRIVFFIANCSNIYLSVRIYLKNKEKIMAAVPFGKIRWSWLRILTCTVPPCLLVCLGSVPFLAAGYPVRFFFCFLNVAIALAIFFCTFMVFSRPEILYAAKPMKSKKKYSRSSLDDRVFRMHFDRLKDFMEHKEGYRDPDLTLTRLAGTLSIPRNDLSRIINEKTGKTFNDFLNFYRVQKVIALFNDPFQKNEPLLTLIFQAGFNSITTFQKAFKKMTGESPVAFRKKLLNRMIPKAF